MCHKREITLEFGHDVNDILSEMGVPLVMIASSWLTNLWLRKGTGVQMHSELRAAPLHSGYNSVTSVSQN